MKVYTYISIYIFDDVCIYDNNINISRKNIQTLSYLVKSILYNGFNIVVIVY